MTTPSCPVCHGPATLERTPPREQTCGTVLGVVEPGLELRCSQHGPQPVTGAATAARGNADERLPRARRCRLRRTCCGDCSALLTLPARRGRRSLTVEATGLPVHTIHLDLPLTRCPDCGLDQVPWRSQEDLDTLLETLYTPADAG